MTELEWARVVTYNRAHVQVEMTHVCTPSYVRDVRIFVDATRLSNSAFNPIHINTHENKKICYAGTRSSRRSCTITRRTCRTCCAANKTRKRYRKGSGTSLQQSPTHLQQHTHAHLGQHQTPRTSKPNTRIQTTHTTYSAHNQQI